MESRLKKLKKLKEALKTEPLQVKIGKERLDDVHVLKQLLTEVDYILDAHIVIAEAFVAHDKKKKRGSDEDDSKAADSSKREEERTQEG